MKTFLILTIIIALSACSLTPREACQRWIDNGQINTSLERCVTCASVKKGDDLYSVRRCSFQRDLGDIRDEL